MGCVHHGLLACLLDLVAVDRHCHVQVLPLLLSLIGDLDCNRGQLANFLLTSTFLDLWPCLLILRLDASPCSHRVGAVAMLLQQVQLLIQMHPLVVVVSGHLGSNHWVWNHHVVC